MFDFDTTQAKRRTVPRGSFDLWLLVALVGLASVGVVMVTSSSIAVADSQHVGAFYFLKKHLLFLGLGLFAAGMAMRTELSCWRNLRSRCWRWRSCCCWRCSCRTSACASTARGAG